MKLRFLASSLVILGIALGSFFGLRQTLFSQEDQGPTYPQQPIAPSPDVLDDPSLKQDMPPYIQEHIKALAEDNAKPRFEGKLGEFVLTPGKADNDSPCLPQGTQELYSSTLAEIFKGQVEGGQCYFMGLGPDGSELFRAYFRGELHVSFSAPKERLKLLTVAGRPAIAEDPASSLMPARLVVIERSPSTEAPGIFIEVSAIPQSGGLERAIELAELILSE